MLDVTPPCHYAAQLTEPEAASLERCSFDVADLISCLQANQVSLISVEAHVPPWLAEDSRFVAALAAERALLDRQRDEYERVTNAWRDHGIPGLLLQSAGHAPSFPYTSD